MDSRILYFYLHIMQSGPQVPQPKSYFDIVIFKTKTQDIFMHRYVTLVYLQFYCLPHSLLWNHKDIDYRQRFLGGIFLLKFFPINPIEVCELTWLFFWVPPLMVLSALSRMLYVHVFLSLYEVRVAS
jgi:hypothetical protein